MAQLLTVAASNPELTRQVVASAAPVVQTGISVTAIIIGIVLLVILIVIIALVVSSSKKKQRKSEGKGGGSVGKTTSPATAWGQRA